MLFLSFQYKAIAQHRTRAESANRELSAIALGLIYWVMVQPTLAHHLFFGGRTPASFVEGFFSVLGHPIVGLDR